MTNRWKDLAFAGKLTDCLSDLERWTHRLTDSKDEQLVHLNLPPSPA